MCIEINMLPVAEGDCIHIRFEDSCGIHNIIVDSGPAKAKRKFRALLQHIKDSGEKVDLLCFSHIDDDHIRAAGQIIPEEEFIDCELIYEVWMNVGVNEIQESFESSQYYEVTVHQAKELFQCLKNKNIPIISDIVCGQRFFVGEAEIEIISPNVVAHEKYFRYWERECEKHQLSMSKDHSPTNGDSIAFVLTFRGGSYVFLGDAYADTIIESVKERFSENPPVLVKISHHGSKNNINEKLLEVLNARHFLISSEADASRPSQETIDLIERYMEDNEKWIYCNFQCGLTVSQPEKVHLVTLETKKIQATDQTLLYSEEYYD